MLQIGFVFFYLTNTVAHVTSLFVLTAEKVLRSSS
ncbi:unnamed protein product [Acanthoscelides obtectus]|uniref:Uncharacterized protein n=1 Tax=Acanthoscelides obtectus TaxID=200917 RepID=A0A9P0JLQ2_ACAOB|nr:unnamed protein product [Acanthoscelides obtectus]CAK1628988.1 hypothetical protein AOBTE_LOCUS5506 [Acanthoscelides obtectus]